MTHREPTNRGNEHTEAAPMYMGKTVAAMYYCVLLGCIAATVIFAWLAVHIYRRGDVFGEIGLPDAMLVAILPSILVFALTVFLMILPSLRAGKPSFKIPAPTRTGRANISADAGFKYTYRKKAIRAAPPSIRRWIRVCKWILPAIFILGTISLILGMYLALPAPLSWFDSAISWMFTNDAMFSVLLAAIVLISIVQLLLERRALKLYMQNHDRLAATDADPKKP